MSSLQRHTCEFCDNGFLEQKARLSSLFNSCRIVVPEIRKILSSPHELAHPVAILEYIFGYA